MKKIRLIGVKSEIGAGTRGASLGMDAIRIASLDFMSNFFDRFPVEEVETENRLLFEPVASPYAKRIKGMVDLYDRVSKSVCSALQEGGFPVVLSGDHASAGATIAGIRMARPAARLGLIWIDAHADLHTPYTTPSGNLHGMPLATALGEDNRECQVHAIDENTARQWEQLKNTGNIRPKVSPEDVVFISLRDYEKEEEHLIRKYHMKVITTAEIRKQGAEAVAQSVLDYLDGCDAVYISFDVDSLDAAISKGTGTPVSNGLHEQEAGELMARFMRHRKVCCFEITEVNPTLDKENRMAEIAFGILQRSVNVWLTN
ncbi:arginase [Compostibacter hankyongensis]|uniref:Arginase n=1 Tax=Compostibacter hankyongensis TaxID=1007089 RepID=A0ABP8G2J7_9BACT